VNYSERSPVGKMSLSNGRPEGIRNTVRHDVNLPALVKSYLLSVDQHTSTKAELLSSDPKARLMPSSTVFCAPEYVSASEVLSEVACHAANKDSGTLARPMHISFRHDGHVSAVLIPDSLTYALRQVSWK
jgi:hypothetical protein